MTKGSPPDEGSKPLPYPRAIAYLKSNLDDAKGRTISHPLAGSVNIAPDWRTTSLWLEPILRVSIA